MSSLQNFIKNRNLELTLFNEFGESGYVGEASDIIPKKGRYLLRFPVSKLFSNVSPWSVATLHSGRKIFSSFYIRPINDTSFTTVEVVYTDD